MQVFCTWLLLLPIFLIDCCSLLSLSLLIFVSILPHVAAILLCSLRRLKTSSFPDSSMTLKGEANSIRRKLHTSRDYAREISLHYIFNKRLGDLFICLNTDLL